MKLRLRALLATVALAGCYENPFAPRSSIVDPESLCLVLVPRGSELVLEAIDCPTRSAVAPAPGS